MSEEQQNDELKQDIEAKEGEVIEGEVLDAELIEAEMVDADSDSSESGSNSDSDSEESTEHHDPVVLLEDARSKADEHWNLYLRTQAEMENLRKRAERDVQNAHKFGVEKLVSELLPIIDSMEMGIAAVDDGDKATVKLVEGMELTIKMFADALQKIGVVQIDPMGEVFDPKLHQAMSMVENADAEPNTVMAVMQKGYVLNDRLVRPAMVVVVKAPAATKDAE